MRKSINYENYLVSSLKNSKEASGYLNAALQEGDIRAFLLALYHVVQAQGGINMLAEKTKCSRTSLYKALSKKGNPYLKSIHGILTAMNMKLVIEKSDRS